MVDKLTFKQYLESKEQLRRAIEKTPQQVVEYTVRKYCKLVVGESKDDKDYVNLKPKNKIFIEWLYEDIDNPTPLNITFEGTKNSDVDEFSTFWQGTKLQKWLIRNAREETV